MKIKITLISIWRLIKVLFDSLEGMTSLLSTIILPKCMNILKNISSLCSNSLKYSNTFDDVFS